VKEGPQDYVFDECKKIGKIRFDFSDRTAPMGYASSLAALMKNFSSPEDIPHLLRHRYIADDFDRERVQEMAKVIADPKNVLVFVTSKKFEDEQLPIHESWYNINHSVAPLSEALLTKIG